MSKKPRRYVEGDNGIRYDLATHEGRLGAIRHLRTLWEDESFAAALAEVRRRDPFPVVQFQPRKGVGFYTRKEWLRILQAESNSPTLWRHLKRDDHPEGTVFYTLCYGGEFSSLCSQLVPRGLSDHLRALVLSDLDRFVDGHTIHNPEALLRLGYPWELVGPLTDTHVDDPDDPHGALRHPETHVRVEHLRGVHDIDMLNTLVDLTGADLSRCRTATGLGRRARQMANAVRRALGVDAPIDD
jgi:hypothetical protein